jgi:hypothetical protein
VFLRLFENVREDNIGYASARNKVALVLCLSSVRGKFEIVACDKSFLKLDLK